MTDRVRRLRRAQPRLPALAAAALLSATGQAAHAAPSSSCPPAPSWTAPATMAAGANAGGAARLVPGDAARLTLQPMRMVSWPAPPGKAGARAKTGTTAMEGVPMGGLAAFTVTSPGIYRVMIDARAWVDLVEGAEKLASVAHAPGPGCSSVVKMVDFRLAPGPQILEISASPASSVEILVTRQP